MCVNEVVFGEGGVVNKIQIGPILSHDYVLISISITNSYIPTKDWPNLAASYLRTDLQIGPI